MEAVMSTNQRIPWGRPRAMNSYLAYSIGCGLVWAVLWVLVVSLASKHTQHTVLLVFAGWVIGWVSASIARLVYPPPKARSSAGPRSFFQGSRPN
jgi:hypothetical protein